MRDLITGKVHFIVHQSASNTIREELKIPILCKKCINVKPSTENTFFELFVYFLTTHVIDEQFRKISRPSEKNLEGTTA